VIYLLTCRGGKNALRLVLAFVLLANLPDFDFLPGWLVGQPNLFHRGASHSLFTALLVGLVIGIGARATGWERFLPAATLGFALYASHVLLDLFSVDYSVPRGFEVLWPLSGEHYLTDVGLFMNIEHSPFMEEFFASLLSEENLKAVVNEVVIFLPAVLLLWGLRGGGARRPARSGRRARRPAEET
jgi:membrane-bound metal-dependent hydrolase YbcI (DUF457 family)